MDNPASNFGWILRGNESASSSAKQFASKENTNSAIRPTLSVTYILGTTTQNIAGLSAGIYSVTVADAADCTVMLTDTVNEPLAVTGSIASPLILCSTDTVLLDLTASGGAGVLTYLLVNW